MKIYITTTILYRHLFTFIYILLQKFTLSYVYIYFRFSPGNEIQNVPKFHKKFEPSGFKSMIFHVCIALFVNFHSLQDLCRSI